MSTEHKFIVGDTCKELQSLSCDSVAAIVTSPPYWSIKTYTDDKSEIGGQSTLAEYRNQLADVWRHCFRILAPGCKIAINIGDQFVSTTNSHRYHVVPLGAMIASDIMSQNWRYDLDFMGSIIWRKITNTTTSGGCKLMGSMYYPRDGQITYEHEYIHLFRKPGKAPRPTGKAYEASKIGKAERSKWFRGVWDDVTPERQKLHPAPFPVELPKRLIAMYTFAGETVLDPFAGSGTTAVAAKMLGRNSINIELSAQYVETAKKRVEDSQCL